ncbi:hypothetical protein EDD73_10752 [Heliophilum fasciatum]|uniref:Uncharacterized protein n=1 Tax=Heliophilum fasciatum TaxID=35700 RepID=A0A4R2RLZ9_9FIRM|nr:hypothetical protein [Heliophilum fasciatum]TCP64982.1 hypothetical protein EDD73_10752 [Heliophilum fasciatum]
MCNRCKRRRSTRVIRVTLRPGERLRLLVRATDD